MKLNELELAYITQLVGLQSDSTAKDVLIYNVNTRDEKLNIVKDEIIYKHILQIECFNNNDLYGKLVDLLRYPTSEIYEYKVLYKLNNKYIVSDRYYTSLDKFKIGISSDLDKFKIGISSDVNFLELIEDSKILVSSKDITYNIGVE